MNVHHTKFALLSFKIKVVRSNFLQGQTTQFLPFWSQIKIFRCITLNNCYFSHESPKWLKIVSKWQFHITLMIQGAICVIFHVVYKIFHNNFKSWIFFRRYGIYIDLLVLIIVTERKIKNKEMVVFVHCIGPHF